MSKFTEAKVREIAEHVKGTCKSAEDAFEAFDLDMYDCPSDLLKVFDSETMMCDCCGWFDEPDILNDEQVCPDCQQLGE